MTGVVYKFYSMPTAPEVTCLQPTSEIGILTVHWSCVHTGGLPLTGETVQYRYQQNSSIVTNKVTGVGVNDLITEVHNLVADREYTFAVIAENVNGSSSAVCQPVDHIVGEMTQYMIV